MTQVPESVRKEIWDEATRLRGCGGFTECFHIMETPRPAPARLWVLLALLAAAMAAWWWRDAILGAVAGWLFPSGIDLVNAS